jgi:DNA-binding response OmpR family regulator
MSTLPPDTALTIRLADEGMPLAAIARATKQPSAAVREQLQAARSDGYLLELPREDWPPGFPRDRRALQLSRMLIENRDQLFLTTQKVFHLTRTEAELLMALTQNENLSKSARADMAGMNQKTIDVHVCRIRKALAAFGIAINTLWGFGYRLSAADRRKTMDLILRKVHHDT